MGGLLGLTFFLGLFAALWLRAQARGETIRSSIGLEDREFRVPEGWSTWLVIGLAVLAAAMIAVGGRSGLYLAVVIAIFGVIAIAVTNWAGRRW